MPHPAIPAPGLYVVEVSPHRYAAASGGESPTFLGARKFSTPADAAIVADRLGGRVVEVPAYLLDPTTGQFAGPGATPDPEALGRCPDCKAPGVHRNRATGNDSCANYHVYPSATALAPRPATADGKAVPHA